MTDLHSYTHYYQSRGLPLAHATKLYFDFFWLQDCTGTHARYQKLHGGFFDYKTVRRGILPDCTAAGGTGASAFFWLPDCTGQPPWLWLLFPHRKPIILNIVVIIIHLLHSCIHCDLDHSCSKLHKSRDFHFCTGREIFTRGGKFYLQISLLSVGKHDHFQIWRRRGGSHVTGEVVGVLLFLKKILGPQGYTSPITIVM